MRLNSKHTFDRNRLCLNHSRVENWILDSLSLTLSLSRSLSPSVICSENLWSWNKWFHWHLNLLVIFLIVSVCSFIAAQLPSTFYVLGRMTPTIFSPNAGWKYGWIELGYWLFLSATIRIAQTLSWLPEKESSCTKPSYFCLVETLSWEYRNGDFPSLRLITDLGGTMVDVYGFYICSRRFAPKWKHWFL